MSVFTDKRSNKILDPMNILVFSIVDKIIGKEIKCFSE
jgi:hypothetical protein